MLFSLFVITVVAPCAHTLGIFSFICDDPGDDCSGWLPFYSAISTYSETRFYLVVNPGHCFLSTGSVSKGSYDRCVHNLRPPNNPDTVILAYVDTASVSSFQIQAQIDAYAAWNTPSPLTGIFFDSTNASSVAIYQSYISYAKKKGLKFIVLDPGKPPNPDFYTQADLVITYESYYTLFSASNLVITPSTPASKQAVLLYQAPLAGQYKSKIAELTSAGITIMYITDASFNRRLPRPATPWSEFAHEIGMIGDASTNASTTSPPGSSSSTTHSSTRVRRWLWGPPTHPFTQHNMSPSTPVGAIVGGVLGGVIAVLIVLILLIWYYRRRQSHSPNPPINPFRSLQPQTLVVPNDKASVVAQQAAPDEIAGPSQLARPSSPRRKQRFRYVEYLPSHAMPRPSGSSRNPPPYSTPPPEPGRVSG